MAATAGLASSVAWASTNDTFLALFRPKSVTINATGLELDTTGFTGSLVVRDWINGIREWTGTLECELAAPISGHVGTITFASGYVANANAYTMDLSVTELDVTPFAPTARWKTYIPSIWGWNGTYSCYIDDTTALKTAGTPDPSASATFTVNSTGTNTLAGSIQITGASKNAAVGTASNVTYNYRGDGQLTAAGSANIYTAGTLSIPATSVMTVTWHSGRTWAGSCFLTGISLSTGVGQSARATLTVRGTGQPSIDGTVVS